MRVGDGRDRAVGRRAGERVALGQALLGPAVGDLAAARVLGQVAHGGGPAVGLAERDLLAAREPHLELGRAQAVLVVRVVPDLLHGGGGKVYRRFVRNRYLVRAVLIAWRNDLDVHRAVFGILSVDLRLDDTIVDLNVIRIRVSQPLRNRERQAGECGLPVPGSIKCLLLALRIAPDVGTTLLDLLADGIRPVAFSYLLLQLDGYSVVGVPTVAIRPLLLYLDVRARIVLGRHGVASVIDVVRIVGRAVRRDLEAVIEPCKHVSLGSLNLAEEVARVFVYRPTELLLIASHHYHAVVVGSKHHGAALAHYGSLIGVQQGKLCSRELLVHVAGFIFHELDNRNRCRAPAAVRPGGSLAHRRLEAAHLSLIAKVDLLGVTSSAVVSKDDTCPIGNDNRGCIRNVIGCNIARDVPGNTVSRRCLD